MPSACGVSWDGTSGGKLEESSIPDDDFESHYLNAGDTKSDSSFPVVDGSGNLRAGNVNSAWDLKGQGEGVSEECLRKLDNAFDEDVLPESAYENSETVTLDGDDSLGIHVSFATPARRVLDDGFNEHGVRVNEDGSVDVRFRAMEPGTRRGVDVTENFLTNVVSHDYSEIPVQLDHSKSQMANVGIIEPDKVDFVDDGLHLQAHFPNTGSSVREDVIADFTHDPPQIRDGSIGFDPKSVEVKKPEKRGENIEFVDAQIREFSLTPFPAGYDDGGLTPEFSEAVEEAVFAEDDCGCGPEDSEKAESQLATYSHTLIKTNHD